MGRQNTLSMEPGELMAEYLPEGTEGQTVVVELSLILT